MRVTISHREESAGLTGSRRNYFVDCTVELSEEEKAIIKARDLFKRGFPVAATTPEPTNAAFFGTVAIRLAGVLLIIAGFILGGVVTFTRWNDDGASGAMFFGGIGIAIYGWLRGRRQIKRLDSPDQEITLRRLLSRPFFTVAASDPAEAKAVEDYIRSSLTTMKELISGSADLNKPSTFEL